MSACAGSFGQVWPSGLIDVDAASLRPAAERVVLLREVLKLRQLKCEAFHGPRR